MAFSHLIPPFVEERQGRRYLFLFAPAASKLSQGRDSLLIWADHNFVLYL
jgi:hypothetical protein